MSEWLCQWGIRVNRAHQYFPRSGQCCDQQHDPHTISTRWQHLPCGSGNLHEKSDADPHEREPTSGLRLAGLPRGLGKNALQRGTSRLQQGPSTFRKPSESPATNASHTPRLVKWSELSCHLFICLSVCAYVCLFVFVCLYSCLPAKTDLWHSNLLLCFWQQFRD